MFHRLICRFKSASVGFVMLGVSMVLWPGVGMPRHAMGESANAKIQLALPPSGPVDKSADASISPADQGQGLPADPTGMVRRLDTLMEKAWKENGVAVTKLADDATFYRRLSLDLTGNLPTVAEVRAFLRDKRDDKRDQAIQRMLGLRRTSRADLRGSTFASYWANQWTREIFRDAPMQRFGASPELAFENWLKDKLARDVPYDQWVKQMLLAGIQPTDAQAVAGTPRRMTNMYNRPNAMVFFTAYQRKPEDLAGATSRFFMGTQIHCAQCHEHPFADWKQEDFWGMAAFFAEIQPETAPRANAVNNIYARFTDKKGLEVKLPDSETVVPPRFLGEPERAVSSDKLRREVLADWLANKENPFFARAAVNRVWAQLFARGLIDPVDDMGKHNQAIHPEVLDDLTQFFIASNFDLKTLVYVILNSKAYQAPSRAKGEPTKTEEQFARMRLKPFTNEQVVNALARATLRQDLVDAFRQKQGPAQDLTTQPRRFVAVGGYYRTGFAARLRQELQSKLHESRADQADEYQGGIPQALSLMNGDVINDAVSFKRSYRLQMLNTPAFEHGDRVDILFLATLSRLPSSDERSMFSKHLESKDFSTSSYQYALSDILWALINSGEFTMNR